MRISIESRSESPIGSRLVYNATKKATKCNMIENLASNPKKLEYTPQPPIV